MIFELTAEEELKAKELDDRYTAILEPLVEKHNKLTEEPPTDPRKRKEATEADHVELLRAMIARDQALEELYSGFFDEHFRQLGNDPEAIVKSAFEEIDNYIIKTYEQYEHTRITGLKLDGTPVVRFRADDVRATENGLKLDAEKTLERLLSSVVSRHLEALKSDEERTARITDYIVKAINESPYTSLSEGELFGEVKTLQQETTEENALAVRPTNYTTTVDKVSRKLFADKLTKPLGKSATAMFKVPLDRKGEVFARASLDYEELLAKGTLVELPRLSEQDYNVHDAILSLLLAGNTVMTYDMIYRAMSGKVTGKVKVPDGEIQAIDKALSKFRGNFKLKYEYQNKDGTTSILFYDEPLVTFQRIKQEQKVNGKIVKGGIRLSADPNFYPPLLKWAMFNHNEIDTRDIRLLDVPGLNNGDESFSIKMCLYRRLISMRNTFERKKGGKYELNQNLRTITYKFVYDGIGLSNPNANKRRLIKDKIDRCLQYWKDKGLITGFEHKRNKSAGNQFYAVVVSFLPPKSAEGTTAKHNI